MKLRGYLKNPNIILTGKEYPVTVQYALEPDLRELVISFGKKRDKNSIKYIFPDKCLCGSKTQRESERTRNNLFSTLKLI